MCLGRLDPVSQQNFANSKNQDDDDRQFEKSKNRNNSTTDGPISTKFGMPTRLSPPDPLFKLIFALLKIQHGG